MSASLPTDRVERDALAGEYVLGTVDAADARTAIAALKSDPAFQRQVTAWEDRLAPLSRLALPESAPPDLWDRIEARLPAPVTRPAIRTARKSWLASQKGWRLWAIGASLAAAFAGVIAVQATRPPVLEAAAPQQADPSQPSSALAT